MDLYRTPFLFLLPDSREQYSSFLGTVLSLLTMLLLGAYLSHRFTVLWLQEEYKITQYSEENYFDVFERFSVADGFKVAAGVTTYDGTRGLIEDPEIGTVKFYLKYYNNPDFEEEFGFHELESEYCDPVVDFNDVDDSNPESGFFPL